MHRINIQIKPKVPAYMSESVNVLDVSYFT